MFNLKLFPILFLSFFLLKSCYPVSHVIIGEKQTPLDFNDVKVYHDYPDNYEKIAIIEASSDIALKDLSIEFTDQKKTDKALERLKKEAASLGANGIVIIGHGSSNSFAAYNGIRVASEAISHDLNHLIESELQAIK